MKKFLLAYFGEFGWQVEEFSSRENAEWYLQFAETFHGKKPYIIEIN